MGKELSIQTRQNGLIIAFFRAILTPGAGFIPEN
jgi:hypothetical protein